MCVAGRPGLVLFLSMSPCSDSSARSAVSTSELARASRVTKEAMPCYLGSSITANLQGFEVSGCPG